MTAGEDVVEAAVVIQIGRMQGEAAGRIARHGLEEPGAFRILRVTHAGADPIAFVQQLSHYTAADETGAAGDRNQTASWYWCHELLP